MNRDDAEERAIQYLYDSGVLDQQRGERMIQFVSGAQMSLVDLLAGYELFLLDKVKQRAEMLRPSDGTESVN